MKKKINLITSIVVTILMFVSCTESQRAKKFGGNYDVEKPKNTILINSTWKNNNLWLLVKDTTDNSFYMLEYSDWGLLEGRVNIK